MYFEAIFVLTCQGECIYLCSWALPHTLDRLVGHSAIRTAAAGTGRGAGQARGKALLQQGSWDMLDCGEGSLRWAAPC